MEVVKQEYEYMTPGKPEGAFEFTYVIRAVREGEFQLRAAWARQL